MQVTSLTQLVVSSSVSQSISLQSDISIKYAIATTSGNAATVIASTPFLILPNTTALVLGTVYIIQTPGTTNWVSAGAANNNIGTVFVSTINTTLTGTGSCSLSGILQSNNTNYLFNDSSNFNTINFVLPSGFSLYAQSTNLISTAQITASIIPNNLPGNYLQNTGIDPREVNLSNITRVATSATNTILLVANENRKRLVIRNEAANPLYVVFGTGASLTNYTYIIASLGYYDTSVTINEEWKGEIDGILTSGTGVVQITEFY
jgi:hypothetical protein